MRYARIRFRISCRGQIARVVFPAIALIALLLGSSGCGKKGDPIPPKAVVPTAVGKLAVEGTGSGIGIAWTMPAGAGSVSGFRVLRGELPAGNAGCPGCPREFSLLADLAPGARELVSEGSGRYRYHDGTVRDGRFYTYRVIACYRSGVCSAAQESAEILYHEGTQER